MIRYLKFLIERLKGTFEQVAKEQDKIKVLQGHGKKADIKNAKSVIANYIQINLQNPASSENANAYHSDASRSHKKSISNSPKSGRSHNETHNDQGQGNKYSH